MNSSDTHRHYAVNASLLELRQRLAAVARLASQAHDDNADNAAVAAVIRDVERLVLAAQDRVAAAIDGCRDGDGMAPVRILSLMTDAVRRLVADGSGVSVRSVAAAMGLSSRQLSRKAKAATGCNALQLLMRIRMEQARRMLLDDPELPIGEVGYRCGFDDPSNFTRAFRRHYGQSPSAQRTSLGISAENTEIEL